MLRIFWRRLRRDERGFTLIELLIVIAIIAILAAILIPNFLRARRQALVSASKGNLKNIATGLESYFVDENQYPAGAGGLAALVPNYIRAVPTKPGAGGPYDYDTNATNTNYVLCDDTTDTITNAPSLTTWYYIPGGGLVSVVSTSCASITVP